MQNESNIPKTTLEQEKLKIEIRILQQQKQWEFWKSLASILIPVLALLSLVGGGYKYFKDGAVEQYLGREEVFAQGLIVTPVTRNLTVRWRSQSTVRR